MRDFRILFNIEGKDLFWGLENGTMMGLQVPIVGRHIAKLTRSPNV